MDLSAPAVGQAFVGDRTDELVVEPDVAIALDRQEGGERRGPQRGGQVGAVEHLRQQVEADPPATNRHVLEKAAVLGTEPVDAGADHPLDRVGERAGCVMVMAGQLA